MDLLNRAAPFNKAVDRPYNLPWPFPSCETCLVSVPKDPWQLWTSDVQLKYLSKIFPGSASRLVNIVSDECMIKSMLKFYGLTGPEWQTGGFSTHVDWTRANEGGHPGSYTKEMLRVDPDFIRRVRLSVLSVTRAIERFLVEVDDEQGWMRPCRRRW
jgi:hypothetical protein